ncbi:MAG: phosphatidylglycerophosphatase A [Calditrichaeota bacterium]|nr:phosphatidylglycerophosphatase A [Calditrichota bacterium]TDI84464.1 MAG: phosphatidylglycerophosphatase A [Caldithrix sp.]
MNLISRLIATGLFVGYVPFAPGTAGSILGLFLYWAIPGTESFGLLAAILLLFLLGVWSAKAVEQVTGVEDNQIIVIDEIVGVLVTLMFFEKSFTWLVVGCILFRFFDIVKLYPARRAEELPGGWGVMLDDVVAGIYSLVSLRTIQWGVEHIFYES